MKNDIKKMNETELKAHVDTLRKELFNLKLSTASDHIKDNSQFKKLRVRIAQALTCLNSEKQV